MWCARAFGVQIFKTVPVTPLKDKVASVYGFDTLIFGDGQSDGDLIAVHALRHEFCAFLVVQFITDVISKKTKNLIEASRFLLRPPNGFMVCSFFPGILWFIHVFLFLYYFFNNISWVCT